MRMYVMSDSAVTPRSENGTHPRDGGGAFGALSRGDTWCLAVCGAAFIAAVAVTIRMGSTIRSGHMPMAGGSTASMAWTRMPGDAWPTAAASFLAAWTAMMVAMMLPSLVPALLRYRRSVRGTGGVRLGALSALAAAGYFFLWTIVGVAAYPLSVALATIELGVPSVARLVPLVVGILVLVAGALQLTRWKANHLECCREATPRNRALPASAGAAWRHGLELGWRCYTCCAMLMAILLVVGVMNLPVMAAVTVAITLERLAPNGARAARAIGAVAIGGGVILIARAAEIG